VKSVGRVLTNFLSFQEATSVFVLWVPPREDLTDRLRTREEGQKSQKFFSRAGLLLFSNRPPIKNNAVAAFSPVYILYKRNSNTNTRTHTRAARREKKKKKEKEKVRSLLFYPLGDGTIESS